jgi:hypothetical protein
MLTTLARTRAVRIACLAVPLLLLAVSVIAHPKPAAVPFRWELEFKPGDLRVWVNPSDDKPYWYFTYTVTNRTGQEQVWAPVLTMLTDAGEIMPSGEDVPLEVVRTIKALLGNDLLETQTEVIGELLQGKEHARDGLVVWPMPTTDLTEISVFVRGLSGETAKVKNPVTKKDVVLHKTLQRDYLIPGNVLDRGTEPAELVSEQWIFR